MIEIKNFLSERNKQMGIFSKINFGLTKTRNKMAGAIDDLLDSVGEINDDLYTELEELLVMHDVGAVSYTHLTLPTNSLV